MVKDFFIRSQPEGSWPQEIVITLLRVFVGLSMAFGHGLGKLPPSEKFLMGLQEMGFPSPAIFAWCAALSEFVGGLAVAAGLFTRFFATTLVVTMSVAAFVRHAADPFSNKELALMYLFVFLFFVFRGSSRLSVDRLIK